MTYASRLIAPLAVLFILSGCSLIPNPFPREDRTPVPDDTVEATQTEVEAEDAAEGVEETAATEPTEAPTGSAPAATGLLGETVVALGDPAKPGFWLMTPLVKAEQPGRLEREGGAVVQVTLIPLEGEEGAGSQISLSAMRALDIPITELIALKVYGG